MFNIVLKSYMKLSSEIALSCFTRKSTRHPLLATLVTYFKGGVLQYNHVLLESGI